VVPPDGRGERLVVPLGGEALATARHPRRRRGARSAEKLGEWVATVPGSDLVREQVVRERHILSAGDIWGVALSANAWAYTSREQANALLARLEPVGNINGV
jgi:hypothetical protein